MGFLGDVFNLEGGRYPVTNRSFLGTWSMIQGEIYMMHGLSKVFCPKLWSLVMLSDEESAMEGWFRGFGFTVFYIGLFYIFAGLADNKQFAAVSVFMRCIFVPIFFSGYLGGNGAVYYGLADPAFTIITFVVYQNSVAASDTPMCFLFDVFSLQGGRYPVTNHSCLGMWSMIQGAIYMMHGLSIEFCPKLWSLVMLSDEESAMQGWFRGFGFTVFYIGLFYIFAGLADNKNFAAVSVFMRCIFVPILFAGFLGGNGYIPPLMAAYYGLADPTFAIITFVLYQKSDPPAHKLLSEQLSPLGCTEFGLRCDDALYSSSHSSSAKL